MGLGGLKTFGLEDDDREVGGEGKDEDEEEADRVGGTAIEVAVTGGVNGRGDR